MKSPLEFIFLSCICYCIFFSNTSYCQLESENILAGDRTTCTNEGDEVPLENIYKSECFRCLCKNGFVECDSPKCPGLDGCYSFLKKNKDDCCHHCRGCSRNGKFYESGTEWTDENDPCKVLTCNSGVITETKMKCYTPCSDPVLPEPGQCCPSCRKCNINGRRVSAETSVTIAEDPCVTCRCSQDHLMCTKQVCPVLNCPVSQIVYDSSECCPRCIAEPAEHMPDPSGGCLLGRKYFKSESTFHLDECTRCSCRNSTVTCIKDTCPVLECEKEYQIPGRCCPKCPLIDQKRQACIFEGKLYQEGDTWDINPCKSCACKNDNVQCVMKKCPLITSCPQNSKLEVPEGQCCKQCVGNSICTVFGDSYYRTFDGRFNEFKGRCKYLLASDSQDHTFSVRISKAAKSTRQSAWTKIITLKLGDVRVILGKKMRIKVNGEKINVPYRLSNKLEINRTSDSFLVNTNVGIKLLWDGISFIEVSAPTTYLDKLGGLCGNFNLNPKDDLMTRDGKILRDSDIALFEQLWAVKPKNKLCGMSKVASTNRSQNCRGRANRKKTRLCDQLKHNKIFQPCHQKVNPMMYKKACVEDMCHCPAGKCYCQAFMAYVRECERLDVHLPLWRNASRCRSVWDRPANNIWRRH